MGVFTMPSLGADMEAGTLVEWLKQPGDNVARGDIVAVVETEKGAIEIEIFEAGQIETLLVPPGAKVPVGTPLATFIPQSPAVAAPAPVQLPPRAVPVPAPLPRRPAPVPVFSANAPARASPAARRLAQQKGLDLAAITGSGPAGAVLRADVEALAAPPRSGPDLAQMRHAIAAAMARSKREIPHYYLAHSLDISAAQAWLAAHNASHKPEERLLLAVLLIKATALALHDFPEFNGFYGAGGFQPGAGIHTGFAIALRGGGLAAPALHDADTLPLGTLMLRLRDLIARVRRGGFRSSEIADPTITISSLGERGTEMLLPIIYPPQVAILGFGTPQPRPWAVGTTVAIRPILTITLGADHRASDGHRGALFLAGIGQHLEAPETL